MKPRIVLLSLLNRQFDHLLLRPAAPNRRPHSPSRRPLSFKPAAQPSLNQLLEMLNITRVEVGAGAQQRRQLYRMSSLGFRQIRGREGDGSSVLLE